MKIFKFHYFKKIYGHGVSYLDLHTLSNVIDYINFDWTNITAATLNNFWKRIWPGCVRSSDNDNAEQIVEENTFSLQNSRNIFYFILKH